MSFMENKAIVKKLTDALNQQNLNLIDEAIGADYINHSLDLKGSEGYKQYCEVFLSAFGDFVATDQHIVAEGDKVIVVGTATATHKGDYQGVAATGKQIQYGYANTLRIADGKVVEEWDVYNPMNLYTVLGVVEYKGFPGE